MEVHFHTHHAEVSDHMRKRAEREVRRAAERIPRIVEAIVRFEQDGALHRVSLILRAPRNHDLVARAEGRFFGPALVQALGRIRAQATRERQGHAKERARRFARARPRV